MDSSSAASRVSVRGGFLAYLFKDRWRYFVTVVAIVIVAIFIWSVFPSAEDTLDRLLAVPVSLATFFVAVAIGVLNMRREWVDSLPWRLSLRIQFWGPGPDGAESGRETALVFGDIPMASPANAREWAQQLAGKALSPSRLPLGLFAVNVTESVVKSGSGTFRRMCLTQAIDSPVPSDAQSQDEMKEVGLDSGPEEVAFIHPEWRDKLLVEGADLRLECRAVENSLDALWCRLTAGEELPMGKKN